MSECLGAPDLSCSTPFTRTRAQAGACQILHACLSTPAQPKVTSSGSWLPHGSGGGARPPNGGGPKGAQRPRGTRTHTDGPGPATGTPSPCSLRTVRVAFPSPGYAGVGSPSAPTRASNAYPSLAALVSGPLSPSGASPPLRGGEDSRGISVNPGTPGGSPHPRSARFPPLKVKVPNPARQTEPCPAYVAAAAGPSPEGSSAPNRSWMRFLRLATHRTVTEHQEAPVGHRRHHPRGGDGGSQAAPGRPGPSAVRRTRRAEQRSPPGTPRPTPARRSRPCAPSRLDRPAAHLSRVVAGRRPGHRPRQAPSTRSARAHTQRRSTPR